MTTPTTDPVQVHAEHLRRQQPTYDGLGALDVAAQLRNLARFVEYATSAVQVGDVARARDAALAAQTELAQVSAALEQATPAVELSMAAAEARRVGRPWEPVQGVIGGPPLEDSTWSDPVIVAAGDLAAMTHGWSVATQPPPPAALRACAQLARQQPQRVPDLFIAAGRAYPRIRGALLRDGCLPADLQ